MISEVRSHEDDQPQLGQFCRLELHLGEPDVEHYPKSGAVELESPER